MLTVQEQEDKKVIQRQYRRLLRTLKVELTEHESKQIRKAFEMAVEAHKEQRRKSGEPYILHPIEVARICVEEIGLGPVSLIAALLHDVVEDTSVTLEDIEDAFGARVRMIVDGLTKLEGLYDVQSPQAENFRKVLSSLAKDVRICLIKLADRLHNMRTIGSMPQHKQLKIASETDFIYAPLAHRLGLYKVKTEFQDICMKITDPDHYHEVATKLKQTKRDRTRYINEFIKPLSAELDEMGVKHRIFGRAKSISSIWNKLKTKKVPFEQIYDLFAVRIIVDVPKEKEKSICWQVYSVITDYYQPIPERLKDWISTPKANGYESLHTTVVGLKGRFVEVQVRSERMDAVAECGFAAHWKYKEGGSQDTVFDTWLGQVREILENPGVDALEFLSDFKTNLFNEEVFAFTPKGDMHMFPKGATAPDFAFSIHSDVGYHCIAIKVNKKIVPMGYKLQNGDQLEVVTSAKQKPTESWLKMVITGKARSRIRQALREDRRLQAELGKEALMRKLKNLKADFEESVDFLVKHYGYKNRVELYIGIDFGSVNLKDLKGFRVDGGKLTDVVADAGPKQERTPPVLTPRKKDTQGRPRLMINGEDASQYSYTLATCCNAVHGDDIFGYLTAGGGLKIHRTTCPNATHLMANYGYRITKAEWMDTANTSFVADLLIEGMDDIGVIQRLTNVITNKLHVNMRAFSMDGDEGYYQGKIKVVVFNKDQLNFVIQTLQNEEGVQSVTRIE